MQSSQRLALGPATNWATSARGRQQNEHLRSGTSSHHEKTSVTRQSVAAAADTRGLALDSAPTTTSARPSVATLASRAFVCFEP